MAESSPEQRVELTLKAWRAYRDGDLEGVLSVFHPDVVVHVPIDLANSGTYRGHDEFVRWLAAWLEAWESFDMQIVDAVAVGDRHVVCRVNQTGIGRGSGIEVNQELGWLFEIRDLVTVYIGLFGDFDSALAAAREREDGEA